MSAAVIIISVIVIFIIIVVIVAGIIMSTKPAPVYIEPVQHIAQPPSTTGTVNTDTDELTGEYSHNEYQFEPMMDSGLNDIRQEKDKNVLELKRICSSTQSCKGFNTNGWLKHTIKPRGEWSKWTTNPTKGLYIKM